jgi:hypothetical protein
MDSQSIKYISEYMFDSVVFDTELYDALSMSFFILRG